MADGGPGSDRDAGTPPAADGGSAADPDAAIGPAPEAPIRFAASCPSFDPCGGDPEGTWQYVEACFVEAFAGLLEACPGATVSDEVGTVQGTVFLRAGAIVRETRVHTAATIAVPPSCAVAGCATVETLLGAGLDGVSCAPSAAGCSCDVSVTTDERESGTYTIAGPVLTTDSGQRYEFCALDDELTYREIGDGASEDGTFELERR